ncbi:hypothetical protein FACS189476_00680 [Spirochaetia bacterium]|nr:hypothetical protein FACS189476_00680 [Spirochaetia bacterium]
MNIGFMVFVIIIFLIFAFINRVKNATDNKTTDDLQDIRLDEDEENEVNNIEELFFEEVSKGSNKITFLKINNQFDLMFIKSLFQSEQIPYYIEFEKISKIRPGMYVGDLGNYNLLYILEKDYEDALKIVNYYIENKKNQTKEDNIAKTRNLAEILFGNWKVPSAQDLDGIEIICKK